LPGGGEGLGVRRATGECAPLAARRTFVAGNRRLSRFRAKWIPVRAKKTRQYKNPELRFWFNQNRSCLVPPGTREATSEFRWFGRCSRHRRTFHRRPVRRRVSGEKSGFEPKRRRLYGGARTNRGRPFERSRDLCFDFIDAEHGRRAFGVPGRRQGGGELVFIEFVEAAIPEDAVAARYPAICKTDDSGALAA
jgi:hypothetical protein